MLLLNSISEDFLLQIWQSYSLFGTLGHIVPEVVLNRGCTGCNWLGLWSFILYQLDHPHVVLDWARAGSVEFQGACVSLKDFCL